MRYLAGLRLTPLLMCTSVAFVMTSHAAPRELTLEQRIQAQEAIERVYHAHVIGTIRPFEQAVPRELLERKVRTYLKQSVALERFWGTPVTTESLQAELFRIARQTRFPDRLLEIYAALHHDPVLIAECFARPILVERLSRTFRDRDARIKDAAPELSRENWWKEVDRDLDESLALTVASTRTILPNPGEMRSEGMETSRSALTCAPDDTWIAAGQPVPGARYQHLAVWTGNEMIIWGGTGFEADASSGGRYNPLTDSWTPTSLQNAPAGGIPWSGANVTAGWTGSEMLIWSGDVRTGARYDPATDAWQPMATLNSPDYGWAATGVWTGTEWIVWGGAHSMTAGARYNPATDTWTAISPAPIGRYYHEAVWTGALMLVWGGLDSQGVNPDLGARYDPATDSWSLMSAANAPVGRLAMSAVWTGSQMLVWGGSGSTILDTGGRYDPASNTWAAISTSGAPVARYWAPAVWTGTEMLIWGGNGMTGALGSGGSYDPSLDAWTTIPSLNAPSARRFHTTVWTGDLMIVWGGDDGFGGKDGAGGRFDPVSEVWTPVVVTASLQRRFGHATVWTGSHLLVWGGTGPYPAGTNPPYLNTGERYDPLVDAWSPISTIGAPSGRQLFPAVWTGSEMIVWGGQTETGNTATGGRYSPSSDSWADTSMAGAPSARWGATAVWTGTRMIVWGGRGLSYQNTGGRYDPVADSWQATSTVGALSPRGNHRAIWTGSVMLVVGGSDDVLTFQYRLLGRYDPALDTWSLGPVSPGQTRGVVGQVAVWDGASMLVWGGAWNGVVTGIGARYNPVLDSWTNMSTTNAPSARQGAGGVWTGHELVVWGGAAGGSYLVSGGRYDPSADTWTSTSQSGAPTERGSFTMTWTGSSAVVMGGALGSEQVHAGGAAYALGQGIDDDGDGASNCADCAPLDAGAIATPLPVTDVSVIVIPGGVQLTWVDQSVAAGSGTRYDVFSGLLSLVGAGHDFSSGSCAGDNVTGPSFDALGPDPLPGDLIYYLIRAQNACPGGTGSYGDANRDATTSASASPCDG